MDIISQVSKLTCNNIHNNVTFLTDTEHPRHLSATKPPPKSFNIPYVKDPKSFFTLTL